MKSKLLDLIQSKQLVAVPGLDIKTDYQETGKLYPKLDLFMDGEYITTSEQFESSMSFGNWFHHTYDIPKTRIMVRKAKE